MNSSNDHLIVESVSRTAWREFWQRPLLVIGSFLCLAWVPFSISISWEIQFAIVPAALFWALAIGPFIHKIRGRMIAQFAASNGYQYSETGSLSPQDGAIFNVPGAHSKQFSHIVTGQVADLPFRFLLYQYAVGQGRQRRTHSQSLMVIEFPSHLPHIVVDSKSFDSLNFDFHRDQMVQLEGDFNKYFKFYVPKEYEIEGLEIFTPNIMAQLIDKSKYFDVELINNRIYIYAKNYVDTRQKLLALHQLVETLVSELSPKLSNYRLTPIHPTVPPALKRGWAIGNPLLVVLLVVILAFIAVIFAAVLLAS